MSFIEGIGDEVVLFFVIVFVFAVAALITLVGSVPPAETTTTVIRRYEYEQNSSDQRENSDASASIPDSTVRLRHTRLPVGQVNSFVLEETTDESNDNEATNFINVPPPPANDAADLRTEADGSSLGDAVEDTRTEADGSSELLAESVGNHRLGDGQSDPPSENSEVQAERQPGEIRVRLKYLNDTERIVITHSSTKIGDFKKKHFRDAFRENKIVRLIFAGRLLQDHTTVESCRILDNSVVHVQVLPAQTMQNNQPTSPDTDLDVGRLLVPAVTLLLGMCWVLYSKYPEFFSRLSLGVLGTLSCFFLAYVVQSRR